jgi:hypothetical protein
MGGVATGWLRRLVLVAYSTSPRRVVRAAAQKNVAVTRIKAQKLKRGI